LRTGAPEKKERVRGRLHNTSNRILNSGEKNNRTTDLGKTVGLGKKKNSVRSGCRSSNQNHRETLRTKKEILQ